jgi:hypothetical protein
MSATVVPGGVCPLTKYNILAMLYLMGRAKQVMIRLVTITTQLKNDILAVTDWTYILITFLGLL